MTDFHVEVVRLGKIGKHPNADNLQITQIRKGIPCIFRTGDFQEGDLAVYIPVDSVVPTSELHFSFLGKARIKARKIRGIFSMGLLIKPKEGMKEGDEVSKEFGVTKWEDPIELSTDGLSIKCPVDVPIYDLESVRRFPEVLQVGEIIHISEKIHGMNMRFLWDDNILYVGTKNRWVKEDESSAVWHAANKYKLKEVFIKEKWCFYAECFGKIQDLKYGMNNDVDLRVFDIYDYENRKWVRPNKFDYSYIMDESVPELPFVPTLYLGPYKGIDQLNELANGDTTVVKGLKQIREGIVVEPVEPRWNQEIGRVKLKHVSEAYLLRK